MGGRRAELFAIETNMVDQEDDDTIAGDLIGNLLHLVTEQGRDPKGVLESAWSHFTAEAGLGYDD